MLLQNIKKKYEDEIFRLGNIDFRVLRYILYKESFITKTLPKI